MDLLDAWFGKPPERTSKREWFKDHRYDLAEHVDEKTKISREHIHGSCNGMRESSFAELE